jgi:hypothetical protein
MPRHPLSVPLQAGISTRRWSAAALVVVALLQLTGATPAVSQTAAVDLSTVGPQIGARAPEFSGVDQLGRTHSLGSLLGPKGAMLVFFRSADW